jgi:glycosyltransferase involved in cell wall biosynthesis
MVWTAHNVLPHSPVFVDDRAARRWLLAHVDAVIALSAATVPALQALGACRPKVIPPGSTMYQGPVAVGRSEARERLGLRQDERVLVFVGQIQPYKGVDRLLTASAALPEDVNLRIVVVGRCPNDNERRTLERLAAQAGDRVMTRFEFVPDDELPYYLVAADAAVLPFVAVSNSGSLMLAVSFGLPVVIPDLEELKDVPQDAALRYETEPSGLQEALLAVAAMEQDVLEFMSDRARDYASSFSWEAAALETRDLYDDLLARNAIP